VKLWQKIGLVTLAVFLVLGARIFFLWKARQDPGAIGRKGQAVKPMSQDELAVMKMYYFASFDMAKQLEGMTVWMKAGYSMPYYPYAGGRVDFAKRAGVLPSAEKIAISKLIKASVPAKEDDNITHGSKQYFAVFTFAGPDVSPGAKPGTFAVPIGYVEGDDEKIYADRMFYYDDPKTIYDNWPKPVWDAVAAHEARVGMNELQVQMAVGTLQQSDSRSIGNRTVTYDAAGKSWTVTYAGGVATAVKAG
jgi:hypothetical protein